MELVGRCLQLVDLVGAECVACRFVSIGAVDGVVGEADLLTALSPIRAWRRLFTLHGAKTRSSCYVWTPTSQIPRAKRRNRPPRLAMR